MLASTPFTRLGISMDRSLRRVTVGVVALAVAIQAIVLGGVVAPVVLADTTAQALPFAQAWTTTTQIAADDDWTGVPGITGYRGDDLTTATGTDPQTIVADGTAVVDVIANQTSPDTLFTGGVAEFEITDPVVALQGSGTADAPHLVIALNTTGLSNITVAYSVRDIDGSADNATQPVALQFRVGATGNYTNVASGFVADATTGPSLATLVTPVSVVLPSAADNQAVVHVRVITTNAVGSDEWVGIDNIAITGTVVTNQPPVADCGPGVVTDEGTEATTTVTASDPDGTVTNLSIVSITPSTGSPETITIGGTTAETETSPASATVTVAATTPPGDYDVTIRATNNDPVTSQTDDCILDVTVVPDNAPVVVECGPDVAVMEGESTTATVTASDADGTVTSIVIDAPAPPPAGISAGSTTAESGPTPASVMVTIGSSTAVGTYTLTMEATNDDATPQSATCDLGVTVIEEGLDIWEIQGAGHISDDDGDAVTGVDGIVSALRSNGFYMTDPPSDDDANDATSNGIFVFTSGAPAAVVGDHVSVNGTVDEFRAGGSGGLENLTITEIVSPTVTVVSSGNTVPVTIVGSGGRTPPTTVIDPGSPTGSVEDAAATFDAVNHGIDFKESLEGMLVRLVDPVAVGPTNGFGELAVLVDGGGGATLRTARGGIYIRPSDFNPEVFVLDDAIAPVPVVNVGDEFTADIFAIVDYSFGNFKLFVTSAPGRVDNGLAREATTAAATGEVAIATFNVENLAGNSDQAKYDELAAVIVNNLRSPDVIGIEEIQDNDGGTNSGVTDATVTWTRLIAAITTAGGPVYQYRQIDPVNNSDGGQPGGNIRVGFLFRTDRGLEFVDRVGGTSTNETTIVGSAGSPQLTFSPGRIGSDDAAFLDTRKSLAGEFRFGGETFIVVVNHFSSKGSDDALYSRFQPPVRYTEFANPSPAGDTDGWRWGQAQVINNFVDTGLGVDPNLNLIVLGDINDFQFSETVQILRGTLTDDGDATPSPTGAAAVLANLFDLLPESERYSYVFEGNSQVLDQMLVTSAVLAESPSYDVVHVNSEFAAQVSDHEPSVTRVGFGAAPPPATQSPSASPTASPTVSPTATATGTPRGSAVPDTAVATRDADRVPVPLLATALTTLLAAGALARRRLAAPRE